jgi:hypothetical protein
MADTNRTVVRKSHGSGLSEFRHGELAPAPRPSGRRPPRGGQAHPRRPPRQGAIPARPGASDSTYILGAHRAGVPP